MYTMVICTQWPYVHNGHMYTKQIMTKTSIHWSCVERTAFCKGILATDLNSNNGHVIVDHNHASNEAAVVATKCVTHVKRKAATTEDKPGQIFATEIQRLDEATKEKLALCDIIKRSLRNHRTNHLPKVLATLQELKIEKEWTKTSGLNPQPFMFYDNAVECSRSYIKC